MLLSKVMASPHSRSIQIIAMSATMSGLEALSAWLRSLLFMTNFRPVPLTEHAVFQGTVYVREAAAGGACGAGAWAACVHTCVWGYGLDRQPAALR